jgi:nitrite transporter NirC
VFDEEYELVAQAAVKKVDLLEKNLTGYLVSSILAGAYVSFGVFLIYTIQGLFPDMPGIKILMGASFAVALSLIIMAGSELFTGNNLVMTAGMFKNKISFAKALKLWVICYLANFIGCVLLSFVFAGTGLMDGNTGIALNNAIIAKTSPDTLGLLTRAFLCNALVCTAVWCTYRMKSETGKLIITFWCIFTFVISGFEHSIANMTLFTTGLLNPMADGISISLMLNNLFLVTVGNMLGGIIFSSVTYYLISMRKKA